MGILDHDRGIDNGDNRLHGCPFVSGKEDLDREKGPVETFRQTRGPLLLSLHPRDDAPCGMDPVDLPLHGPVHILHPYEQDNVRALGHDALPPPCRAVAGPARFLNDKAEGALPAVFAGIWNPG